MLSLAATVLLALVAPPTGAAPPPITPIAPIMPAPSVVAATSIAVPDILARASAERQRLAAARQLLASSSLQPLRDSLARLAAPVDAKLGVASGVALRNLPIMRLESLARHWEFDARRFDSWQLQAHRTFAPYDAIAMGLSQSRAAWSATRAAGLLDGLPPVLAERVDAMVVQIDEVEAQLGEVLASQFELLQRSAELKARIESGRGEVAAAIDDVDERLLRVDVPPLWRQWFPPASSQAMLATMRSGLEIEQRFAIDYNAARTGNQLALRIVQFLLLPLLLWLAVRSRHGAAAGAAGALPQALRRPVSAWLLLSMLSVLALEPDAPLLVQEFAMLLALVPVLRLLPAGATRSFGIWPYVAIALYGLDRSCVAVVADAGLYRLWLLVLNALALGLTWRMLRQPLPAVSSGRDRRLQAAIRLVGRLVLGALLIAAACNVAGNVSLAEMLTSGVIDSGYMALLLYASVAACQDIVRALLNQPGFAASPFVRRHAVTLDARASRLLALGALLAWLLYSMHRLRVLRPVRGAVTALMQAGLDVGEVSIHIGAVLVFVFSAWLAFWAARTMRRVLREELPGHTRLPRGVGNSIASLSYYGVLLLGLLLALSAAGFRVSQLALVFGALGVGIGFGLQNVVNNFVSGLVLMFERPIQPGDVVDAAGVSGTVREIGLRATTIRTFDGADSVVPNGLLLSGNLTNWTMFDQSRRFEITIAVAHGCDPAQVLALLGAAASNTAGVAREPAPVVLLTASDVSGLTFAVRAWTGDLATWGHVRGDLLAHALAALQAAGISLARPRFDVDLRSVEGQGAQIDVANGAPSV